MKVDVEKVKMDVEHSLLEWGVDPDKTWDSSERSRFKTFKKLAELTAIDYALSTTTSPDGKHPLEKRASELSKEENSFPAKPEQAAKYLLKDMLASIVHERGKVRTSIAKDAINMGFAPYFRHHSGDYKCRKEFRQFSEDQLNPFKRFSHVDFTPQEYLYHIWSNEDSLSGNIFEALASSYIVYNLHCKQCDKKDCIRWNGGFGQASSWSDLLCLQCKSTYEIKSKRGMKQIKNGLKFGFNGSSYRMFHRHAPVPGSKRYLVVISRTEGSDGYQVIIDEIKEVAPKLSGESFTTAIGSSQDIHIKSEIKVLGISFEDQIEGGINPDLWCTVPACGLNQSDLAKDIFNDHFGKDAWQIEKANALKSRDQTEINHLKDLFRSTSLSSASTSARHKPWRPKSGRVFKDDHLDEEGFTLYDPDTVARSKGGRKQKD